MPDFAKPEPLTYTPFFKGSNKGAEKTEFSPTFPMNFPMIHKQNDHLSIEANFPFVEYFQHVSMLEKKYAPQKKEAGRPPECSFLLIYENSITSYHKFSSSYKDMKFDYIF